MSFLHTTNRELTCGAKRITGFTLVEVVVSVGILLLVGGAMIAFERGLISNTRVLQSDLISQQQARKTFSVFTKYTRSAGQSASGGYAIEYAGTSTFVFYSNVDSDPLIERVRYFLDDAQLNVGVTKPVGTAYAPGDEVISNAVLNVANDAFSPLFVYYDKYYDGYNASSSDPLSLPIDIPSIRMVKMQLSINHAVASVVNVQTYVTQASIRNLKDNL